jgi:hypothetical protein
MFKLILLIAIALFASCAHACCTPKAWRGQVHGHVGVHQNGTETFNEHFFEQVYYDYEMKALRADFFADVNHQKMNGTILYRYDTGTAWYWPLGNSGGSINECFYADLPMRFSQMLEACVPESRNELWYVLGGEMTVTRFEASEGRQGDFARGDIVVSRPLCYPISGEFFDHQNRRNGGDIEFNYINIETGIEDRAIFDHPGPSICSQVNFPSMVDMLVKENY